MLLYGLIVFVGSVLLFFVQPMMGKFLLPWFGGSAAVWSVCLLFFQVGLLGGYAYAHALGKLRPRLQAGVHVGLLAVAVTALAVFSVVPDESWRPEVGRPPAWQAWLLLTTKIGLPYFLLASTAPLIQRWFSLRRPRRSPYGLYGLSNAASMLALLGYPVLAEPAWTRGEQAHAWSLGFLFFAVASTLGAVGLWRAGAAPAPAREPRSGIALVGGSSIFWVVLPAVSCAMLLAFTDRLGQSLPPVPFLWVIPLVLYLLTYVLCFRVRPLYHRTTTALVLVAGVLVFTGLPRFVITRLYSPEAISLGEVPLVLSGTLYEAPGRIPAPLLLGLFCLVLFAGCLFLHGELYRLRPAPARLTAYYLAIAAGGALGGASVAIAAPLLFDSFIELPAILCVLVVLILWFVWRGGGTVLHRGRLAWKWGLLFLAWLGLAANLADKEVGQREDAIETARNFYGVHQVFEYDADKPLLHRRTLVNNQVKHGVQFMEATNRLRPASYYTRSSGVAIALRRFPLADPLFMGVIGLGTGTLATFGSQGDRIRFYEIDPKVIDVAREFFTYMSDSLAEVEVVEGDARLILEHEPPQGFDVLVIDAFAGDAIPVHLLTVEAFELYERHLSPRGIIAVHVTNSFVDLLRVMGTLAAEIGVPGVWVGLQPGMDTVGESSVWVVLSRDPAFLAGEEFEAVAHPLAPLAGSCTLWTDEFSAPFEVLWD